MCIALKTLLERSISMEKYNKREDKKIKLQMLSAIESHFENPRDAGLFIAMIADLLDKVISNDRTDMIEMRTIEIKINNFFSVKYDFIKDEIIKENG